MGPASIESHYDEALSVPGMLQQVAFGEEAGVDGYVIACFGDPGLDAARELATGPVVGIAEAAMHAATLVGRSFSIVTTLARTIGRAQDLVAHYGFASRCVGVHACDIAVLALEDPTSGAAAVIVELCRAAVRGRLRLDRAGLCGHGRPVRVHLGRGRRARDRRRGGGGQTRGRARVARPADKPALRIRPAAAEGLLAGFALDAALVA